MDKCSLVNYGAAAAAILLLFGPGLLAIVHGCVFMEAIYSSEIGN